ncbi:MAG: hypothetical protein QOI62_1782 [Solirubrobacteraceae bacterium]|nr:hypothetical protein [Solirubrobacteraceae bacterium]
MHTRKVTVKAPVTDVQSSGGDYGTVKAEKFKQADRYQRDTRAAYDASPPQQKRQTLDRPMVTPERRTVQLEHVRRLLRSKDLGDARAQHDVRKAEAPATGRQMARDRRVEHLIHNLDGTIGERNSYGDDPYPPRG